MAADQDTVDFIGGGGEMGGSCALRLEDLCARSAGELAPEPSTTVRLALNARHPMLIWWGPELVRDLAMTPTARRSVRNGVRALGDHGRACWAEILAHRRSADRTCDGGQGIPPGTRKGWFRSPATAVARTSGGPTATLPSTSTIGWAARASSATTSRCSIWRARRCGRRWPGRCSSPAVRRRSCAVPSTSSDSSAAYRPIPAIGSGRKACPRRRPRGCGPGLFRAA